MAVRELPDFETMMINQPLILLERVQGLVHTPMKSKYPSLTPIDILSNFLPVKQDKNENLFDYLSRFKSIKNVLQGIMGTRWLDEFTENSKSYKVLAITDTVG